MGETPSPDTQFTWLTHVETTLFSVISWYMFFFQPNNYPLAQCSQPQSARCDSKFYMIVDSNIVFIVQFHYSSIIPLIFLYSSIIVFLFLFYSYLQWQNHIRITSGHPVPIPAIPGYQLAIRYLASHGVVFPDALVLLPGGLGRAHGDHGAKERESGSGLVAWFSMGMLLMLRAILWGYKCRDII